MNDNNFYNNIEADMFEQESCKKIPLGELIFFFSLHYSSKAWRQ